MLVGFLFLGGNQLKSLGGARIHIFAHLGMGYCQLIQFIDPIPDRLNLFFYVFLGGKRVRDQIHSHEVVQALWAFAQNPRPGGVYNLGGGRANSASLLECTSKIEALLGRRLDTRYQEQARKGDHICYISDLTKFHTHYPEWLLSRSLDQIIEELVRA